MYRTMARIINSFCAKLETAFPEIAKHGWGITGLFIGTIYGVKRVWNQIQTPGAYSKDGGLKNAIKKKAGQLWNKFWVNPTGNEKADKEEIIRGRVHNIVRSILLPLFLIAGLTFFVFATIGMIMSAHNEVINFLTNPAMNPFYVIPETIATIFSYILVVGAAGFVRSVFNLVNASNFFSKLGEGIVDLTAAAMTKTGEIIHGAFKFCTDREYAKEKWQSFKSTTHTVFKSVTGYLFDKKFRKEVKQRWKEDPSRHSDKIKEKLGSFFNLLTVIVNGFASGALVYKGDLQLHGAESVKEGSFFGGAKAVSTTSCSIGVNYLEFKVIEGKKPAADIPLQKVIAKRKQAEKQKEKNTRETMLEQQAPLNEKHSVQRQTTPPSSPSMVKTLLNSSDIITTTWQKQENPLDNEKSESCGFSNIPQPAAYPQPVITS